MSQTRPYSSALARALGNLINTYCSRKPTFEFTTGDVLGFPDGPAKVEAGSNTDTQTTSADADEIFGLAVTVTHGATGSNHTIAYEDNDRSETLTCDDTILAIS